MIYIKRDYPIPGMPEWNGSTLYYAGQIVSLSAELEATLIASYFAEEYDPQNSYPQNYGVISNAANKPIALMSRDGELLTFNVKALENTIGAARPFGHQAQGSTNSVGGAEGAAFQIKGQAEAPFKRMKILIHNRNMTYPTGGWEVSFAATEDPRVNNLTAFCQPIVDGVTYTALGTNDATKYGYKPATFGGVARSKPVPPASFPLEYRDRLNISKPSGSNYDSFFNAVGTIASDWINVPSVPSNDGSLPWFLVRAQVFETISTPFGGRQTRTYLHATNTDTTIDIRGGAEFREYQGSQISPSGGANYITDPSLTITLPADNGVITAPNVTILFDYGIPTRNVFLIGDSVTEGYPWAELGLRRLSTTARPINFVNCGQSARQTYSFNLMWESLIESGVTPTDIFLPAFSVNDYSPATSLTDFEADKVISRLIERIELATATGAKVWLWTSFNGKTGLSFAAQSAQVAKINNFVREYVTANPDTCGLFDFDATFLTGTGVDRDSKDGTHPNNNGILKMASIVEATFV